MIAMDGGVHSSRGGGGVYGGGGVTAAGSNGGPNMAASSFAAAAAAAAAASNGSNSTVSTMMMMPGPASSTAANSVQQHRLYHQQHQQEQEEEDGGITTWSEMMRNRREYTLFKKLVQLLQDNRLKSGDEEAAEKLRELNRSQNERFPVLKSILNAIFITTGVVLLIAVVVVIIYTSIGEDAVLNAAIDSVSRRPDEDLLSHPRTVPKDYASPPSVATQRSTQNDWVSAPQSDARGAKICRAVPIEQEGENRVRLVPMCFHTSSSSSSSSSTENDRPG